MRIMCNNCNERTKLPLIFWGYKFKCKSCNHIINFKDDLELFSRLRIFNLIVVLILLIIIPEVKNQVYENLVISKCGSLIVSLVFACIIVIVFIIPTYRFIIYHYYTHKTDN